MVSMAELSRDDILKLARLARLRLSDQEISDFQKEISDILEYVDQLKDVNVEGLKPTYQVTGLTNIMRDDKEVAYAAGKEALLKNAPQTHDDYFKVNRMVG